MRLSLPFYLLFFVECRSTYVANRCDSYLHDHRQLKATLNDLFDIRHTNKFVTADDLPRSVTGHKLRELKSTFLICQAAITSAKNHTFNPCEGVFRALSQLKSKVAAGVLSGTIQAGLFHPWDRALYLSQTNNRYDCPDTTVIFPLLAV